MPSSSNYLDHSLAWEPKRSRRLVVETNDLVDDVDAGIRWRMVAAKEGELKKDHFPPKLAGLKQDAISGLLASCLRIRSWKVPSSAGVAPYAPGCIAASTFFRRMRVPY